MTAQSVRLFGIGVGIAAGMVRRHAVDVRAAGSHVAAIGKPRRSSGSAVSLCGEPVDLIVSWGDFDYGSRWLHTGRCPRCGWILALHRRTVADEVAEHTRNAGPMGGLLSAVFAAIMADTVAGRELQRGRRSDLLAHAAMHAPVRMADGHAGAGVVCRACTLSAGGWAGGGEGRPVAETVVAAPCSALGALTRHYGLVGNLDWAESEPAWRGA